MQCTRSIAQVGVTVEIEKTGANLVQPDHSESGVRAPAFVAAIRTTADRFGPTASRAP
jgi:hypothetical protein